MGRFQNPGDMISTRGINFILLKNCQILQPGGSNSSNSQSQSSQLKPRGHSIFQSSLFNFTIWQFYNPGGYIDSGRGHVPSSYNQTRGASKKGGTLQRCRKTPINRVFAMQKRVMQKEYKTSYCVTSLKEILGTVDYAKQCSNALALGMFLCVNN